jgi:hypothetical protein
MNDPKTSAMEPAGPERRRASMRVYLKWIAVAAAALFVGVQFVRPALPNRPITGDLKASQLVTQILRNSCYDCHSNETRLLWFDYIVPGYWLVVSDVKRARQSLNFSEFDQRAAAEQKAALFEAVNQIQFGAMPPKNYQLIHPESRVTPGQLAILKQYLNPARQIGSASEQFKLPSLSAAPTYVRAAPNGLAFIPEYKNWKAISSTERFDNHTMRVVLANDVALGAIADNHIKPWPDGTAFAKVAWDQSADGAGNVQAGKFVQVEFMIKDRKKYASTLGWGWGRWRGTDLQPYGTSAAFTAECVGCHTPLRRTDFVFTTPIAALH